jgi:YfdX protein
MKTKDDVLDAIHPLGLSSIDHGNDYGRSSSDARASTQAQTKPALEKERKQAEQEVTKNLDREAIAAFEQTLEAVEALARKETSRAMAAIEGAIGKIDVVLARNASNALIPVDLEVEIIDTAPQDTDTILDISGAASIAVDDMAFPTARRLLRALMSEIRIRTYNLPLATYPAALKSAARLVDHGKEQEAATVLMTALGTLVAIDNAIPIPLLIARASTNEAQTKSETDKNAAQELLVTAKNQLERSRLLGYAGRDPAYTELKDEMSKLQKQLKGGEDTTSVFAKLKEKVSGLLNRQAARKDDQRKDAA